MHELFAEILGFVFEYLLEFVFDLAELFNSGRRRQR
jgi:hypothetical protein